mmetsp:Transcript_8384/g.13894  ORF Transcript_8384/g.13894 Transcript_8384/m.13894 type:complete len:268 (-) Transcript_8384:2523-3326(-)
MFIMMSLQSQYVWLLTKKLSGTYGLPVSHCDDKPFLKSEINGKNSDTWNYNWDMRQGKKSTGIRQVILIRHGQYVQGVTSDEKRKLTELGVEQARRTGKRLRELIDGNVVYPIRSVKYSTMTRATQTFLHILPSLPPLRPYQCQPCSMIREAAVCRPDPPSLQWKVTDEQFAKEGTQTSAAFANYIQRAVDEEEDGVEGNHCDIFVCHGNVIRYFVMRALQLPPEAWLRTAVYNASITVLTIYPSGRVSLYGMGDVGHLPVDMITYN